eukprot:CAMPEP_0113710212 /NCGR_PEP_ID=MMETSP0038_2-20120614/30023_1 /TAXON_ID=2898 /ORGANISM="Cryptomonas paramecium" /LENGTH=76 /DNA_ID=CAMNT_0000636227 /DNA_START=57 /DNA_END=284 /DNA_ORIENTATION=+ /assembly_acc=CAM_ASM_000170
MTPQEVDAFKASQLPRAELVRVCSCGAAREGYLRPIAEAKCRLLRHAGERAAELPSLTTALKASSNCFESYPARAL